MLAYPLRHPFFNAAFRVRHVTAFRGATNDALECFPCAQFDFQARVKQVAVARIPDDQPVLSVVADEAFRDALNRFGKAAFTAQPRLFRATQRRDIVKPEQPLAPGHGDVPAVVGDLHI